MASTAPRTPPPSVAVLLATCGGEPFLRQQLDSFAAQTHAAWSVWASDDASPDGTRAILEEYQRTWAPGRLTILEGPGQGLNANFAALTDHPGIAAAAYAYADQDDVWVADKLERAMRFLQTVPDHVPALYCGRTRLIDADGQAIGLSPLFSRPPSFRNALVQNLAGGNTMVFNHAARALLQAARPAASGVVLYDWWMYMLVTGAGGMVHYDPLPSVAYRQHGRNLVGANASARERIGNVRQILRGRLRDWTDCHLAALDAAAHLLTAESLETLAVLKQARGQGPVGRVRGLRDTGLYRQTPVGDIVLWMAALLNRI